MIYSKNYSDLTKIFFRGYSICQQTKQNAPGLYRGLSLNFCWLGSANYMQFIEEYVMCADKYILFTNKLNMGLSLQAWVKKTVHQVETHWLCIKKKFQVQLPGKKRSCWQPSEAWKDLVIHIANSTSKIHFKQVQTPITPLLSD